MTNGIRRADKVPQEKVVFLNVGFRWGFVVSQASGFGFPIGLRITQVLIQRALAHDKGGPPERHDVRKPFVSGNRYNPLRVASAGGAETRRHDRAPPTGDE